MTVGLHIKKFGRNIDIDIADAPEDVIEQGGEYPWPLAAFTPTVVSSSANDHVTNGQGAKKLRIEGLDANFQNQFEIVDIQGIAVVTATKSYMRIYRAYVTSSGALGMNAGVIQVKNGGAVVAQIAAELSQTQQAVFTTPANNNRNEIVRIWLQPFISATDSVTLALQTRDFESNTWRTRLWAKVRTTGENRWVYAVGDVGIHVGAKVDIRLRVLAVSADNTVVSGGFDVFLDNSP